MAPPLGDRGTLRSKSPYILLMLRVFDNLKVNKDAPQGYTEV